MDEDALIERARAGDEDAKRSIVEQSSLRLARVVLGSSAKDRHDALRELGQGDGPAPGLGLLLAATARDEDGEIRRALERVYRERADRWGPPERETISRFVAKHGARLGAELAVELVEWSARYPGDHRALRRGAEAALADVGDETLAQLSWRTGFEEFVLGGGELVQRWTSSPGAGRAVAKAMFSAHERGRGSIVPLLDVLWVRATHREVWTSSIAEATSQHRGMTGQDELAAWGWQRFCAHPDEQRALYAAFRPWRDLWSALNRAMPGSSRPGGGSAASHLTLWGGLDVEQLSGAVDEAVRLAEDREWADLVDITWDLAERAPAELRRPGLAGACRIAQEITNRSRNDLPTSGIEAAADRLIARTTATASSLRASGAVLDESIASCVDDLETDVRMIREARARRSERAAEAERRAEDQHRMMAATHEARLQVEAARLRAEEARAAAELARVRANQELRDLIGPAPTIEPAAIDHEVFFSSLPAPTLTAYVRLCHRLSSERNALQTLASEGVTIEMMAVISQTWSALFAKRPDLAMRFSTLMAAQRT